MKVVCEKSLKQPLHLGLVDALGFVKTEVQELKSARSNRDACQSLLIDRSEHVEEGVLVLFEESLKLGAKEAESENDVEQRISLVSIFHQLIRSALIASDLSQGL